MFPSGQTFLQATLAGTLQQPVESSVWLPTGILSWLAEGIMVFRCESGNSSSLIISAGIHGNETAPVEMVDKMITDILKGKLQPEKNCLFILGNPLAMTRSTRYNHKNLNRLFVAQPGKANSLQTTADYETQRAGEIMKVTTTFAEQSTAVLHFDLHTAIRPSKFEKFALFPYTPATSCPDYQLAFLARSGIEALLIQNKEATTFSSWTATEFASQSFTIELGKVNKFGQNDPAMTAPLDSELRTLLCSKAQMPALTPQPRHYPRQFTVVHEIINTGRDFQLNIAEDTPNFTEFLPGYEIWRNATETYRVSDGPVTIVFPNSQVGPGERAGLLVKAGGIVLA
jgi:succinylglutamate desuccinylase